MAGALAVYVWVVVVVVTGGVLTIKHEQALDTRSAWSRVPYPGQRFAYAGNSSSRLSSPVVMVVVQALFLVLHNQRNVARKKRPLARSQFIYTYSVTVVVASAWVIVAFAKVKVVVVLATSVTTTGSITVPRNLLQYEDASGCWVRRWKARRHRLVWHVGGTLCGVSARTAAMAHMAQRERMDDARMLNSFDWLGRFDLIWKAVWLALEWWWDDEGDEGWSGCMLKMVERSWCLASKKKGFVLNMVSKRKRVWVDAKWVTQNVMDSKELCKKKKTRDRERQEQKETKRFW